MLFRTPFVVVALAAAALSLTACNGCGRPVVDDAGVPDDGGDGDAGGPGDAGETGDDDAGAPDAGVEEDAGTGPVVQTCADAPPATPPAGAACAVTPGAGGLAITADVLLPGFVYEGGTVVVNDEGTIVCSGCECAQQAQGKTAIVCPDAVVSPGLVNGHDHMGWMNSVPWVATDYGIDPQLRWEHRHDWRRGRRGNPTVEVAGGGANADEKAWGELRFVLGGATSTNGSGSSPGFLRNVDRETGLEGLDQPAVRYETFPLDDASGTLQTADCAYGTIDGPQSVDSYTPHVSEGIDAEARNEFLCLTGQGEGATDALQENAAIIHGVGLLPADVATMAARGIKLIWSPRSNVSLYGNTAPIPVMKRLGVEIALGTDWIPSGSMNMLRELACADALNKEAFGGALSDEDLWRSATLGAARALAMDDALGVLLPGRVADLAVFAKNGRSAHRAVIEAGVEDVALVLRAGTPLSGDAAIVDALEDGCDPLDVCGVDKRVCVAREIGKTLTELEAAVGVQYPLFFCGVPADEPTCTMSRALPNDVVDGSTQYTGAQSDDDPDGDGVVAGDLCPSVFDPVRPLDDGAQGDADGDGAGDACDVCPLAADEDDCPVFDPDDRDADGRTDLVDNCPDAPNPDQLDQDEDLKGDVCDPCPAYQNPGDSGCAALVYDVKTDASLQGRRVAVLDLVVTAVAANGFFAQLDPASTAYAGVEHSGIFAFTGSAPRPARGDRVNVLGATVTTFFGQIQLSAVEYAVVSQGADVAPRALTAAELAGAIAEGPASAFEAVLVEVVDVVVTDPAPPGGPGDADPMRNEFEVAGGLYVDDALFLVEPQPQEGETFSSIVGPLSFRNDRMKLLPRDAQDLVFGTTGLASFGPSTFQRVGRATATFPEALTVRLSRATTSDTTILVASSDEAIASVAGGQVVVPAGQLSAEVPVVGTAPGTATLTARLDVAEAGLTADVRVLAVDHVATLASLSPATTTTAVSTTATFTVALDVPAPAGGVEIALSTDVGALPATVRVEEDRTTATFEWSSGTTAAAGSITATLGDASVQAAVEVVAFVGSLVINEVDYDQAGTDASEFVEIFNGTNAPIAMAGHKLLLVNGSNNSVYKTIDLAGAGTLPAGGFLVVASPSLVVPEGAAVVRFTAATDNVQNGEPDGIALVSSSAVVDSLSYEGGITAVPLGSPYGTVNLVPPGGGDPDLADANDDPSPSLARRLDGVDTGKDSDDWMVSSTPTPGTPNQP